MNRYLVGWIVVLMAGCATVEAGDQVAPADLCDQALAWNTAPPDGTVQILPSDTSDDGGRVYRFDLAGRDGLRELRAECGGGAYAECAFRATRADGRSYAFSDLSTFGLWERDGELYLLYRIVDPKSEAEAGKRRIVKIGDPPATVCNRIGDYSNLM